MSVLLGPDGRPISSSTAGKIGVQNKKSAAPITGNAFGDWAGRDVTFATLPGGGVVQFDLSQLRVEDFRAMRDHYQVNASLAVLSFMQHQSDWHIECEDKKIAENAEVMLRENWTQLNRGLSQANWAGYSPNVLEWDNNVENRSVDLAKIKDLVPEECRVNWKKEEGWAPPGHPTKPKFKKYDGIKQFPGTGWPIPVDNCVTPETLILTSDMTWRTAGSLSEGDEILAFDENEAPRGRRYKTAVIEVNRVGQKECVTVSTDIGDDLTLSVDHPCLVRRGPVLTGKKETSQYKDHWEWIEARDLQPGDRMGYFGDKWEEADDWQAGYIAGIVDGEGSITESGMISFSQRSGNVLDRSLDILDQYNFTYTVHENKRDDCKYVVLLGGVRESIRFIGMFRPERIGRNKALYENVSIKIGKSVDLAVVQSVKSVGLQTIASIQTSSGTFITQGYLTHNTFWYPLLMENGDYYGRKLLRPAFQSWFFSILLHLFANRYYERFGEPTPIGRAPFDDQIEVNGTMTASNTWMLNILQQLRNRSVVVLPNERQQMSDGKFDYEYDIQYLESQMRGADFERYMTRLDEEISIGLFTPVLMLRTADVGSYNLGQQHLSTYQVMLNSMNGDRKFYIDKYILSPWTNFNYSPKAPRPRIVFTKLGEGNMELVRDILVQLIKNHEAKPDLVELGQMTGLTLTEIKQTLEDPPAPGTGDTPPAEDGSAGSSTGTGNRGLNGKPYLKQTHALVDEINERVGNQIGKAFNQKTFGPSIKVNMGFKNRFRMALEADGLANSSDATDRVYRNMDSWIADVLTASNEFDNAESFMTLFKRVMRNEVNTLA